MNQEVRTKVSNKELQGLMKMFAKSVKKLSVNTQAYVVAKLFNDSDFELSLSQQADVLDFLFEKQLVINCNQYDFTMKVSEFEKKVMNV